MAPNWGLPPSCGARGILSDRFDRRFNFTSGSPLARMIDRLATFSIDQELLSFRDDTALRSHLGELEGVQVEVIGASREGRDMFGVSLGSGERQVSPKRAGSVDVIRAGGGAVWRPVDGRGKKSTRRKAAKRAKRRAASSPIEILLVHRPRYDDWSLPKGKADAGEGWKACARREVLEETGMRGRLGPLLRTVNYQDRQDRPKEVRFYAMSDPKGSFQPNDEVDQVRWLSPEGAIELATRGSDVDVIKDLVGHLSDP